jgi:hypothetical protein
MADVLADDAAEVFSSHRDDLVQDLAPATPNPSFGGSVLPRSTNARAFCLYSGRLHEGNDVAIENGIVIQDGVAIWSSLRKGPRGVVARPNLPRDAA